jgi:site-specific DNA recombinase
MRFAGVSIVTLSEGEVSELHIGLKGTMGALFLKDLADKTRRGLRGRVEKGRSGGGLCYGYDVVRAADPDDRGEREINPAEANVVRRIFRDYLSGQSSRTIAMTLNREGISGPQGKEWGPSTIHGNPKRGTGILNNELYIGRLIWNRLRYMKDPDTGKRVSRPNPESEWVVQEVPDLRIVDQDLWDAVKKRQKSLSFDMSPTGSNPLNDRRRPKHLFAGLIKCGCCGGGYSLISKDLLGCAASRNKGTCDNRLNIRRDALEASILNGLRKHLMSPELFNEFCAEFTREVNRLRIERGADLAGWRSELEKVDRELDKMVDAILQGFPPAKLKDKAEKLEARKSELTDFWTMPMSRRRCCTRTWRGCIRIGSRSSARTCNPRKIVAPPSTCFGHLSMKSASCPRTANSPSSFAATWGRSCALQPESKTPTSFRRPRLWTTCFRRNRWLREGAADDPGAREAQKQKPPRQDRRRHRKYRWLRG